VGGGGKIEAGEIKRGQEDHQEGARGLVGSGEIKWDEGESSGMRR
jgi:hypothetical protein